MVFIHGSSTLKAEMQLTALPVATLPYQTQPSQHSPSQVTPALQKPYTEMVGLLRTQNQNIICIQWWPGKSIRGWQIATAMMSECHKKIQ